MGGRKFKTKETGEPSVAKKPRKGRRSRRSAIKEETIVQMDETIWKELPEELLESVIARLPLATFIRFRLVCHKWNSLPFLQRRAPQELPLICATAVAKYGREAMYDPLVKKWYYNTHTPPDPDQHWNINPSCDSGGGLVCYADERDASFRVGNHLTRTWKAFPWSELVFQKSLPDKPFVLAFVYNPLGAGGYKIVWVDWEGRYGVLDYSSSEEKTTITQGRIPDKFALHSPMKCNGLAIGSVAYFRCRNPDGIISYDVVSGTWEQLLIAEPPNSGFVSLAEGGGRLLLVGGVYCNKNNNESDGDGKLRFRPCVCVWELDTQIRSWTEVDRMPTSYCSEFEDDAVGFHVVCLSNRRLLVISLSVSLVKQRTTPVRIKEIVAYDVVSREWSKVPECIPPGCLLPPYVWFGISFFPSLSASPNE